MKLPNTRLKIKDLRSKKKLLLGSVFSIAFLLLMSYVLVLTKAHAQEVVRTITITPPSVSVTGNPGYRTEGALGIINDSDSPITFKAEMHDFIVQDNNGTPEILPANTLMKTYSGAAWMGVTPQTFTIEPKKRQNLNYYIQIPGNARPGGHYAAVVFVPTNPTGKAQNTGSTVNGELGTLFSIAVNGPIKESANVTKFFANGFQEYGPVSVASEIKNFGDLHIRPKGYITVSDMLGRSKILPLSEFNIFPQAARDFENQVGGQWMLGRYKAVLLASYGVNNNLPLTATLYFWVFPWKVVVVIILLIVAAILGTKYYRKNGLKMPVKPAKKEEVKAEDKPSEEAK